MSSVLRPVRTLTTPPGTSDVASTSLSVTAGSGRVSDVEQHDRVAGDERRREPADEPEQRRGLRRDDPHDAGRLGDREVEVRRGDRVGRAEDLGDLVGPAGVPDPAVDGAVDGPARLGRRQALRRDDLGHELVAPAFHQLRDPIQDLAAVHRGPVGPAGERLARGPDRIA